MKVLITSPKPVFSGLDGGKAKHRKGEIVDLPDDVATVLKQRGLAVDPPQSKAEAEAAERPRHSSIDDTRLAAQKARAEAAMRNHDALSKEQRLAAHDRIYDPPRDDLEAAAQAMPDLDEEDDPCPDVSSTMTPIPEQSPGSRTPTTGSGSSPRKTLSLSSKATRP